MTEVDEEACAWDDVGAAEELPALLLDVEGRADEKELAGVDECATELLLAFLLGVGVGVLPPMFKASF